MEAKNYLMSEKDNLTDFSFKNKITYIAFI